MKSIKVKVNVTKLLMVLMCASVMGLYASDTTDKDLVPLRDLIENPPSGNETYYVYVDTKKWTFLAKKVRPGLLQRIDQALSGTEPVTRTVERPLNYCEYVKVVSGIVSMGTAVAMYWLSDIN